MQLASTPKLLNAPIENPVNPAIFVNAVAIATGQDVDVIEIDAASNRGIDEINQLRQNVAVRREWQTQDIHY